MVKTGYDSPLAVHPGEMIKESLEVLDVKQSDLSTRADISEKTISLILNGKHPVTAETAIKLERVLGISRQGLLAMQAAYEADEFRLKEQGRLEGEVRHLSQYVFYSELAKLGYVRPTREKRQKVEELLAFFSVNSLRTVSETVPVAFRASISEKTNKESLAAWLRIGRIEAQDQELPPFSKEALEARIEEMRSLTREGARKFGQELKRLCAESGVALVYTPYLKNTHANGATRWITPTKALIQISLRFRYADIFWFTFFHEIGHILRGGKKDEFVDLKYSERNGEDERAADRFAETTLIPRDAEFATFVANMKGEANPARAIIEYANTIGISPGIVAGRFARETGQWKKVAYLRRKLELVDEDTKRSQR